MERNENLVILDRDGVINHDSDAYIKCPEEWIPVPGSLEAIAVLTQAGYRVAVATNQSGIARKLFDQYTLARIHQKMCSMVEDAGGLIDGIFFCPHGPDEGCHCRKPNVGLLEEIRREFETDLSSVPYVGDSLKDLQAAKKMGCQPYLVRTGKGEATLAGISDEDLDGVIVSADLRAAVKTILER